MMTDRSFEELKEEVPQFTRSVLIVRASKLMHYTNNMCLIQVDNEKDREALLRVEREKLERNNDGLRVRKGIYEDLRHDEQVQQALDVDEQVDNIFVVRLPPELSQVGPSHCSIKDDRRRFFACGRQNLILELQIKNIGPEIFDGHDPQKGKCYDVWTVNVVMYTKQKDFTELLQSFHTNT